MPLTDSNIIECNSLDKVTGHLNNKDLLNQEPANNVRFLALMYRFYGGSLPYLNQLLRGSRFSDFEPIKHKSRTAIACVTGQSLDVIRAVRAPGDVEEFFAAISLEVSEGLVRDYLRPVDCLILNQDVETLNFLKGIEPDRFRLENFNQSLNIEPAYLQQFGLDFPALNKIIKFETSVATLNTRVSPVCNQLSLAKLALLSGSIDTVNWVRENIDPYLSSLRVSSVTSYSTPIAFYPAEVFANLGGITEDELNAQLTAACEEGYIVVENSPEYRHYLWEKLIQPLYNNDNTFPLFQPELSEQEYEFFSYFSDLNDGRGVIDLEYAQENFTPDILRKIGNYDEEQLVPSLETTRVASGSTDEFSEIKNFITDSPRYQVYQKALQEGIRTDHLNKKIKMDPYGRTYLGTGDVYMRAPGDIQLQAQPNRVYGALAADVALSKVIGVDNERMYKSISDTRMLFETYSLCCYLQENDWLKKKLFRPISDSYHSLTRDDFNDENFRGIFMYLNLFENHQNIPVVRDRLLEFFFDRHVGPLVKLDPHSNPNDFVKRLSQHISHSGMAHREKIQRIKQLASELSNGPAQDEKILAVHTLIERDRINIYDLYNEVFRCVVTPVQLSQMSTTRENNVLNSMIMSSPLAEKLEGKYHLDNGTDSNMASKVDDFFNRAQISSTDFDWLKQSYDKTISVIDKKSDQKALFNEIASFGDINQYLNIKRKFRNAVKSNNKQEALVSLSELLLASKGAEQNNPPINQLANFVKIYEPSNETFADFKTRYAWANESYNFLKNYDFDTRNAETKFTKEEAVSFFEDLKNGKLANERLPEAVVKYALEAHHKDSLNVNVLRKLNLSDLIANIDSESSSGMSTLYTYACSCALDDVSDDTIIKLTSKIAAFRPRGYSAAIDGRIVNLGSRDLDQTLITRLRDLLISNEHGADTIDALAGLSYYSVQQLKQVILDNINSVNDKQKLAVFLLEKNFLIQDEKVAQFVSDNIGGRLHEVIRNLKVEGEINFDWPLRVLLSKGSFDSLLQAFDHSSQTVTGLLMAFLKRKNDRGEAEQLVNLLLQRYSVRFAWKVPGHAGENITHFLAKHNPKLLNKLLPGISSQVLIRDLNDRGFSPAHYLFNNRSLGVIDQNDVREQFILGMVNRPDNIEIIETLQGLIKPADDLHVANYSKSNIMDKALITHNLELFIHLWDKSGCKGRFSTKAVDKMVNSAIRNPDFSKNFPKVCERIKYPYFFKRHGMHLLGFSVFSLAAGGLVGFLAKSIIVGASSSTFFASMFGILTLQDSTLTALRSGKLSNAHLEPINAYNMQNETDIKQVERNANTATNAPRSANTAGR
mgnify:CR=1 FL=1